MPLLEPSRSSLFVLRNAIAVLALSTFVMSAGSAAAVETYSYSGNPFTIFSDTAAIPGSYSAANSVQGSFDIAVGLGANLNRQDITASVVAFSFTDGRQTFTEASTLDRVLFQVSTDSVGAIVGWNIVVSSRTVHVLDMIDTVFFANGPSGSNRDRGRQFFSASALDRGQVNNLSAGGVWTSTFVVPEPSTALLVGLGLAGLTARRRR